MYPKKEKNMVPIGVDQSLSNSALYEHICLETSETKTAGKCHDQHQYKSILEVEMVSNP